MYTLKTQKVMVRLLFIMAFLVLFREIASFIYLFNIEADSRLQLIIHYIYTAVLGVNAFILLSFYIFSVNGEQRKIHIPQLKLIFIGLWAMLFIPFTVGLLNGNDLYYLFGDLYRSLNATIGIILLFWVYCGLARTGKFETIITYFEVLVAIGVLDAIMTFYVRWLNPTVKISTVLYLVCIPWAVFQTRRSLFISLPILLLSISTAFISGKRTAFLYVMMTVVFTFIYLLGQHFLPFTRNSLVIKKKLFAFMATLSVVGIIGVACLPVITDSIPSDNLYINSMVTLSQNVFYIASTGEDESYNSRLNELKNILSHYERYPENLLWGQGFGAEIEPEYGGFVESKNGKMHMVHIGWANSLLRKGLLGIMFDIYVLWKIFETALSFRAVKRFNWKIYALYMIVFAIMGSFTNANGIIAMLPFLFAVKFAEDYDQKLAAGMSQLNSLCVMQDQCNDEFNSYGSNIVDIPDYKTNSVMEKV